MDELVIYLGQVCNNDCIMCSVDGLKKSDEVSYFEIEKKLVKNSFKETISLTGGEPTEHSQIKKIFKKAKEIGYKGVDLSSNGINFSDEKFTKSLADYGLRTVTVSVHGDKEMHNKIVNKKAYKKVFEGIENLLKYDVDVQIDSVLMSLNIDSLPKLWKDATDVGVQKIGITDLIPEKEAKKDPEKLMISPKKRKEFINSHLEVFSNFKLVTFTNFPRCLLPYEMSDNFFHISTFRKGTQWEFDGLSTSQPEQSKKKIKICKKCKFSEECFGFRVKTRELFDLDGIEDYLKNSQFLNS